MPGLIERYSISNGYRRVISSESICLFGSVHFRDIRLIKYLNIIIKSRISSFLSFFQFQTQGRESIAAKLVANLITIAGADRVIACDLHSGQSMGYFDIPVDHVYCQVISPKCIRLSA